MLPVVLEIEELFILWLKNPPPYASYFGMCVLLSYLTERISDGELNAIYATAKIKRLQFLVSVCCLFGLVLCGVLLKCGFGIIGVGFSIVFFKSIIMIGRVLLAQTEAGVSSRRWVLKVFIPIFITSTLCLLIGYLTRYFMSASVFRIMVTTVLMELVFLPTVWMIVLDGDERNYLRERIIKVINYTKK